MIQKKALFECLCGKLRSMIEEARAAREESERESRSHIGAAESRYDTFKEEAQVLAGGHGKRELDLKDQLARIRSILTEGHVLSPATMVQMGAIVRVRDLGKEEEFHYLIVSVGGGLELALDDTKFYSLSFSSPLGRVLLRKEEGDLVEFTIEGRTRKLEILEIH